MATRTIWQERSLPAMAPATWTWFAGTGVALMLFGFLAFANLMLATRAVIFGVAIVMFVGGVVQVAHALGVRRWTWAALLMLSGLLYAAAASIILSDPGFGARFMTLFLGILYGAAGIVRLGVAAAWRGSRWGWLLASGLASIAAAAVILLGWPADAVWMIGLVFAIDLIFQGSALAAIGLALRAERA